MRLIWYCMDDRDRLVRNGSSEHERLGSRVSRQRAVVGPALLFSFALHEVIVGVQRKVQLLRSVSTYQGIYWVEGRQSASLGGPTEGTSRHIAFN